MKLQFLNTDELEEGISLVCEELGFKCVSLNPDAIVTVQAINEPNVFVSIFGKTAEIRYGGGRPKFFRGLAILVDGLKKGLQGIIADERPLFETDGAMIDMSRNAVMRPDTVKTMLRKMALMGMNSFMLYTEDTYEVPERPYFGYMRGRYSKVEIREMDHYARIFGIELVPCIQMLGHLATYLRWAEASSFKDTANCLMVGEEQSYSFLDDLLRTVADCFTSRRLHIGMDETHDLGTGLSLDRNGYNDRGELYLKHLAKVAEMAKGYGFTPMIWSDMFFRLSGRNLTGFTDYDIRTELSSDILDHIPDGVQCVFWDYYHPDEEFYQVNLEKHAKLSPHTIFAGGVWAWSGHTVEYSRSIANTRPALDAAKKAGTKEVIATVWHNGSEASLIMALAGLAFYAEYDYCGEWNEERIRRCFVRTCFADYDDLLLSEAVEYPYEGKLAGPASRTLLYNDPLTGLSDCHVQGLNTGKYYHELTEKLASAEKRSGMFAPAYAVITALSSLLEKKADFGVRLKAAYASKDRDDLAALADECDEILLRLENLRRLHRASWMLYNKPFGWEVHDIRYGGLKARFETAKERICSYLDGEVSALEELEEPRLRMDGLSQEEKIPFPDGFVWTSYKTIATTGIL